MPELLSGYDHALSSEDEEDEKDEESHSSMSEWKIEKISCHHQIKRIIQRI